MTTPLGSAPAAALAAQAEAAAQARTTTNQRKPPVKPVPQGDAARKYEGRRPSAGGDELGRTVDRDA